MNYYDMPKEKLKTLKDLELESVEDGYKDVDKIREEAIKWVKSSSISRKMFIEFFNLTEEDLK